MWKETGKVHILHMADGSTHTEEEQIVSGIKLRMGEFVCHPMLQVMRQGRHDAIMGIPWLKLHNPQID